MQITYDFSALWKQVNRIAGEKELFSLAPNRHMDPIDISLGQQGIEVQLDELENIGHLLSYKGRQILLYIPDQGQNIDSVLAGDVKKGKKFHVVHCVTLDNMRNAGRFQRYFAITNPTGIFPVSGVSSYSRISMEGHANLQVCMNCLTKINYRKSALSKNFMWQARDEFNISEFFEAFTSCFKHFPSRSGVNPGNRNYTSDWRNISSQVRHHANWCCSDCGVDLKDRRDLLHVHHRNGDKIDNTSSNLQPLCAACHRDQPMHETLFIKYDDMLTIISKRRDQNLIGKNWASVMKHADSALHGVLGLAKRSGHAVPEVAYPLQYDNSSVKLDVAWPSERMGIVLSQDSGISVRGWKILNLKEAYAVF